MYNAYAKPEIISRFVEHEGSDELWSLFRKVSRESIKQGFKNIVFNSSFLMKKILWNLVPFNDLEKQTIKSKLEVFIKELEIIDIDEGIRLRDKILDLGEEIFDLHKNRKIFDCTVDSAEGCLETTDSCIASEV